MSSSLKTKKLILDKIKRNSNIGEDENSQELAYLAGYNVSVCSTNQTFANTFLLESVLSVVHHGSNSTVYETVYKGNSFVFKRIQLSGLASKDVKVLRVIDTHQGSSHPNVVNFYYHCIEYDEENKLWLNLFMEKCAKGNLRNWLKNYGPHSNIHVKKVMFLNICKGLQYIHSKSLIHRDLKPENILLDENHICKVADLGLSTMIEDDFFNKNTTIIKGSPIYAAPEKLTSNSFGKPTDIFSLGMIWMELLCNFESNCQKCSAMNALREIDWNILFFDQPIIRKARVLPATILANYPDQGELILKMTEHDPGARPDIDQVIQIIELSS
jgi:serine/threonine protein kinase